MSWPLLAVVFSAWLYVDASYRGPDWQRWLFKPITLLLLLLLALETPVLSVYGYLIIMGLVATLLGDALMLLPKSRVMYALGAFFLSHLFYTLSFATQMTISLFWPLPLTLVIIGAALLAVIWTRLEEMRWPVVTFVAMTLLMVWLAGEQYYMRSTDFTFSILVGTSLLLLSVILGLVNHYRLKFRAADALVAACYFGGHFMVVRSMVL
ncbi:lysoplasmalogenase [Chimaeribacter arupi]|uniref:Lysoplasmalogenase n=2 Tax=Yersiniaceae TaxID=1903411 RepID=A0A2N5EI34_9GAMM|nr:MULTISPECIES: lysoplasmalogenase [Yersiniaceae]MBS0971053.1 lysoplasmalogenase [Nissabacter archeti]MDV5141764.1 lysoplasmalogenase [Chimaeribacter arupi]PLR30330.1 lysoplasmalogenase [Chimaeribacter arupi]PLR42732.1 lysoplasmalogenase [Chimaeribacter arupi]PLR43273.1 lysoplasmalogenase [Chimaeribacter arupi]